MQEKRAVPIGTARLYRIVSRLEFVSESNAEPRKGSLDTRFVGIVVSVLIHTVEKATAYVEVQTPTVAEFQVVTIG